MLFHDLNPQLMYEEQPVKQAAFVNSEVLK